MNVLGVKCGKKNTHEAAKIHRTPSIARAYSKKPEKTGNKAKTPVIYSYKPHFMAATNSFLRGSKQNDQAICLNFPFSFSIFPKILIMKKLLPAAVLLFSCICIFAQQPGFNQNSSRSNHSRSLFGNNENWNFGINSGASFGVNSNESSLFRGNGIVTGLNGQYFFGPLGLGVNGGFINSKLNNSAINQFLIDRKFPQTSTITTSPAQNAFLMLGPSFRAGNKAQVIAGIKGGVFFNQSGGLVIGQQGAVRPLYRFDAGTKTIFPGFNGSVSFSYPVGETSSILLSTDFIRSSSSIQLYDPQRGIDIPVEQKRTFQTINAGISFIKSFEVKGPRDVASGQSSGRRSREAGSGMATGRRQYEPATDDGGDDENKRVVKTKTKSNQSNDRVHGDPHVDDKESIIDPENNRVVKTKTKSNQSNDRTAQSCGPVTLKTTKPDGTVQEQTFSCPDDAVQYQTKIDGGMPNRISMNVTTPKQTQGATFGEKVNQGLQSAGSHIVSGKIVRSSGSGGGAGGIVTNRSALGGNGSGAASASYAATGRTINPNQGVQTNFYVRESSSGQASGRRSREAGSGMATGRRQYQPLYFDGQSQGDVCNPCMGVVNNPLYEEKGKGHNPMHESKRTTDDDCDGDAEGFDVYLIDRNTGSAIAVTKTNRCGEYWFANVPDGNYSVEVSGSFLSKKGYDYYQAQSQLQRTDVAGVVIVPDETWQHILYNNNSGPEMKAGISTSRSNIRTKSGITVATGDVNGDGAVDYYRAVATFSDGTSRTIAEGSISANASNITIPVEEGNQQKAGISTSRSNIRNISIATGDVNGDGAADFTVRGIFSDGTTRDVTAYCDMKQQPGVTQVHIAVGDVDGDGAADLIWSPRSNLGIDAKTININTNTLPPAVINTSRSNIKNMAVVVGDTDGDGVSELMVGNGFHNGDIPSQDDFTQARPGSPIGGLSIKGGKTPGGNIQTQRTNSFGEFQFTNLEPGNYNFKVEATYIINDITDIDLNDSLSNKLNTSEDNLQDKSKSKQTQGSTFGEKVNQGMQSSGSTKAQDHNSSRSNKTASTIATGPNNSDSSGTKVQDHNSSRSNKTASTIVTDPNNTDSTGTNQTKAQNNNTVRSNRIDNAIAVSNDLLQTVNNIETMLDAEPNQTRTGVNTSRSNIKNARRRINDLQNHLRNNEMTPANAAWADINRILTNLEQSLNQMGGSFSSVSNVLKTKHDTAKNAIGNIR
jgi:hypothetical protein